MELRTCTHFHFIQAIRTGSVEKVLNVNSHGRPVLRFKKVEDIYESEDAKRRDSLSTLQPQDSFSDMDFNNDKVKTEGPCPALMGRKTKERESNTNMSYCNSVDDDDDEGTDGLSSEKMTLKQLKEMCKTKKRKALHSLYLYLHPKEDECDLEEPISMWTKIAKNPMAKMKRAKKCSSLSPRAEVLMTSVQIQSAENLMQCSPYLPALSVKVEVSENKYVKCRDITCSSDETSNFCGEQQICTHRPELESGGMISFTEEEFQSCTVNEVCFDHLERKEPSYLLPSISGETTDAENLRKTCQRSLDFPTSEDKEGCTVHLLLEKSCPETNFTSKDQGSDTSNYFEDNLFIHEISRQTSGACGIQVTDTTMDSSLCCIKLKSAGELGCLEDDINENCPPNPEMDSLNSSFCDYATSWDSIPCSSTEVVLHSADDGRIATEKPPLMFIRIDTARDLLSSHKNEVDFEGGSTMKEEKRPLRSSDDDSESNSSEKDHHGYGVHKSSLSEINNYHPEQGHPPERLLSTSAVCGIQVTDMAMDRSLCCIKPKSVGDLCSLEEDINESCSPNPEMDSLSSLFCDHATSWDSIPCSSPEVVLHSADDDCIATEKPPLMFIGVDTARDLLSPRKNQVDFEGGSTMIEEKQPLRSSADDSESNSSEKDHHGYGVHKSSLSEINNSYHPEQGHPPERLLSTRKAISPSSQEKLCQAMKGVELDHKIEHYKCKNKLQFTEDTQDNASPAGPDMVAEVNANPEGPGEVTRTFVAMSPMQMTNQPKNDRKGSPSTSFRRVPRLSRSRPHVTNGPTSIQSCSERAITFSQRQMHDIEGLATKLMHELKFMKDIIEGQVHSEASSPTSLKYDADEVKSAIKSATKAEETTRKWLSMMTRDCTRFCKLMRLNDKGEITSGNAIPKERKKITFADEAGGVLCHVKLIEDSIASTDSKT